MALDGGILAIAIVATITTGIVSVVFIVAIYKCAKVALKMYLQRDGGSNLDRVASGEPGSTSGAGVETDDMEMGMMSYFFEDIQKERPVRFSSQQLRAFTRNYTHKVGSGGFGVVYKGRFPNGAAVAVKVLNSTLGKRAEEQFMAEVGTIGRTYHINLVRLYGFCFDASIKALVYEYLENGSLDGYLFDPPPERKVTFGKLHEIAVGTAKALRYLHEECSQRIIHYDIKPENVLLGAGLEPKVSDFGLARLCDREDTHLTITGARGTPGYAAPELWMPLPVTHKCDVYSYGMLLFEMLGRRRNLELGLHGRDSQEWYPRWVWHRFEAGDTDAVLARAAATGDKKERETAERVCKVALCCVHHRPEDRPSMGSVVRMLEGEDQIVAPCNPFAHLAHYNSSSISVQLSGDTGTTAGSNGYSGGQVLSARKTLSARKVIATRGAASVPEEIFHRAKGVQLCNIQAYQCTPAFFANSYPLNQFSSEVIASRLPVLPSARVISDRPIILPASLQPVLPWPIASSPLASMSLATAGMCS